VAVAVLFDLGEQSELGRVGQERGPHAGGDQLGEVVDTQAEGGSDRTVLLPKVGTEHRWVIGVDAHHDALVEQGRQGMGGKVGHDPGADVGGGTHLERDLVLGQMADEPRVVHAADSVADPLGAQALQRAPHRLGPPGTLAGMGHAVQPSGAGPSEGVGEAAAIDTRLGAAEAEADQAVGGLVDRPASGLGAMAGLDVGGDVEAPSQLDATGGGPATALVPGSP
jgi:hypothetical protein